MQRLFGIFICLFALAGPFAPAAERGLRDGDLVAICGDSITEQKDYSVLMETYLIACQPAASVRAMGFGWSGETAPFFLTRMSNEVLRFHPTVATTCYGMNDGGYGPMTEEKARRYRDAQRRIVQQFKKAGVRVIVVGSPGCVDTDTYRKNPQAADTYNRALSELRDIAQQVARDEGVVFADVFDPMLNVMRRLKDKYGHEYHLAGADGVHPGHNGHLVMAYAFLKALGCTGDIGTISVDLRAGTADATAGHKVLSADKSKIEIESTRYPFCFYGNSNSPDSTTGVIDYLPFNEDLNRLLLIVKGAETGKRYKVTWGTVTKEFSAEELERGINLAAEFLDNPFAGPFKKVQEAVQKQQAYETTMVKSLLHTLPQFQQYAPDEKESLERIAGKLGKKDAELMDASRAAVAPVRHTIKIEVAK